MRIYDTSTNTAIENTIEKICDEQLDALAMNLLQSMREFFDSERGKQLYAEYLASKNKTLQAA